VWQTDNRKNPDLFFEVAKLHPQCNPLWIGGEAITFKTGNFYHVPEVSLPFSYYKLIDYFVQQG
jgi:hypothetical protein